jgi:hypothetical protein
VVGAAAGCASGARPVPSRLMPHMATIAAHPAPHAIIAACIIALAT